MARLHVDDNSRNFARAGLPGSAFTNAAGTAVTLYAAPTGSTLADVRNPDGSAVTGSTLVLDSQSRLPDFLLPDGIDSVYAQITGDTLRYPVFASVDARLDTIETLDTTFAPIARSVEGIPWFLASHSYGVVPPYNNSANRTWITRLVDELHPSALTNASVASYLTMDVAARIFGSDQPIGPNFKGLVLVGVGVSDMDNGSAKSLAGVTNGIRAIIATAQAATKTPETDPSFTYTGAGWSASSGAGYGSGASKITTEVNDSVSISLPPLAAGLNYCLMLGATDSAKLAGCTDVEVKLDGTVTANLNLNDQMKATQVSSSLPYYGVGPYPLLIPGNGSGRTLVLTHKGTAGQILVVDDLLVPQAQPPQVVVLSQTPYAASSYTSTGGATALAGVNAALQAGMAGFTGVTYVDMSPGWDPTTMCFSGDGLHPNDLGHATRARTLAAALNALPYRAGMNIL